MVISSKFRAVAIVGEDAVVAFVAFLAIVWKD
jgi:hypothetical protein